MFLRHIWGVGRRGGVGRGCTKQEESVFLNVWERGDEAEEEDTRRENDLLVMR